MKKMIMLLMLISVCFSEVYRVEGFSGKKSNEVKVMVQDVISNSNYLTSRSSSTIQEKNLQITGFSVGTDLSGPVTSAKYSISGTITGLYTVQLKKKDLKLDLEKTYTGKSLSLDRATEIALDNMFNREYKTKEYTSLINDIGIITSLVAILPPLAGLVYLGVKQDNYKNADSDILRAFAEYSVAVDVMNTTLKIGAVTLGCGMITISFGSLIDDTEKKQYLNKGTKK